MDTNFHQKTSREEIILEIQALTEKHS